MSRLVETIKCFNGELMNLRYHQSRFNLARKAHFRPCREINLSAVLEVPAEYSSGLFRCRIIYSREIEQVEFHSHNRRPVNSLRLVESNRIDYRYKYTNRQMLEQLFMQRGNCDDVLIVKNGFITDSLTANVVFYDGRKWWTPDTPLLPGTQRARLVHERKIFTRSITPKDIPDYKKAGLINAMQDMNEMPEIAIEKIFSF